MYCTFTLVLSEVCERLLLLLLLLLLLGLLLLFDFVIFTTMHVSRMRLIQDTRILKAHGRNKFMWDQINNIIWFLLLRYSSKSHLKNEYSNSILNRPYQQQETR